MEETTIPNEIQIQGKESNLKKNLKRGIPYYIMFSLPVIWYLVLCYLPMFGLVIAFEDYNLFVGFGSPWATNAEGEIDIFIHFKTFLEDPYFWNVLYNTFRLGFWNTIICFPAPIILALLFNEINGTAYKKITQTLSYLPYFVSAVALVGIMTQLMSLRDGLINNIINILGAERIDFMQRPQYFTFIYVILNFWRSIGWGTIVYIAAISGIDQQLYEAATLDGAGRWKRMWHITLPSLKTTIVILGVLAIPGILNADFESVLLLQQPTNYSVSNVISTYVYNRGIGAKFPQYDYATAMGLFFSCISLIVIVASNKISNKVAGIGLW